MSTQKTYLLAIEGLIAAGKTTLIQDIKIHYDTLDKPQFNLHIIGEALDQYTHYNGNTMENQKKQHNPLALSYGDPNKNLGFCQIHIIRSINNFFNERIAAIKQETAEQSLPTVIVADRSLLSPLPFIHTAFELGYLSDFAKEFLEAETMTWAENTLKEHLLLYTGIYYLTENSTVCLKRSQERGREYEAKLSQHYMSMLQQKYHVFLSWWQQEAFNIDLLSPFCNDTFKIHYSCCDKTFLVRDFFHFIDDVCLTNSE
jgi:deoxyadenosine/deoxycytidine kinase